MRKPKKTPIVVKKRFWHPAVMANLMRQAQEEDYRLDAENRVQRARAVCKSGTERKREENQRRHQRPRAGYDLSHAVEQAERAAHGGPDVADHHGVVRAAYRGPKCSGLIASDTLTDYNFAIKRGDL